MPERRRAGRRVVGILVVAVLVTATVMAITYGVWKPGRSAGNGVDTASSALNENSPLADLNKALLNCDARARDHRRAADSQAEGAANSLYRRGSLRVDRNPGGAAGELQEAGSTWRVNAVTAACRIFDRFAVEPCRPAGSWPSSPFTTCSRHA